MKSGCLAYSELSQKYVIISKDHIDELRCGDALHVFYNDRSFDTSIELDCNGKWYFSGLKIKPNNGLTVARPDELSRTKKRNEKCLKFYIEDFYPNQQKLVQQKEKP